MIRHFKRFLGVSAASSVIALLLSSGVAHAFTPTVNQFSATASAAPYGITVGPDGNLWFAETAGTKIGKLTPGGTLTEYGSGITASGLPKSITSGPDGNLWFTEQVGNKIGKITTSGTITEYTIPTGSATAQGIVAGPDNNLWFTEYGGNKIGKITTGGSITEYPLPTGSSVPWGITSGPDGNLWFAENNGNRIGKITTSGTITEYTIPTASAGAVGITTGSDNNLWFVENSTDKIGKITTSGTITEYPITASSHAEWPMLGTDGNIWYNHEFGDKISYITPTGVVRDLNTGTSSAQIEQMATDASGNIWFAQYNKDKIGELVYSSDWDNDNISNTNEDAAPNSGDANNDGTPDVFQANVTSLSNFLTGNYTSMQSSCATIFNPQLGAESSSNSDSSYSYPMGLIAFTAVCGTPGVTATTTQYYYGTYDATKYVLREWDSANHIYTAIPGAVFSNVTVGGQPALKVVYQITDGSAFDLDGAIDGNVKDPVGIALADSTTTPSTSAAAPSTGFGTYTTNPLRTFIEYSLIAAALFAASYATRKRSNN